MLFLNEEKSETYFLEDIILRENWSSTFETPLYDYFDYFVDYVFHEKGRPCRRDIDNSLYYGQKFLTFFFFTQIPLLEGDRQKETIISVGLSKRGLQAFKESEFKCKCKFDKKGVLFDFFVSMYENLKFNNSFITPDYIFIPGKKSFGLSGKGQEHIILLEKDGVIKRLGSKCQLPTTKVVGL